jgi:hypothetical protein
MSDRISARNWNIADLPGLNSHDCQKLEALGIHTTFELLQSTRTQSQRVNLASQLQLHPHHLQKWIALADLARVPSVGCQYCGLLLHAGITSPSQLSTATVSRLHRQVLKLHVATFQRNDLCPQAGDVAQWVQQARCI